MTAEVQPEVVFFAACFIIMLPFAIRGMIPVWRDGARREPPPNWPYSAAAHRAQLRAITPGVAGVALGLLPSMLLSLSGAEGWLANLLGAMGVLLTIPAGILAFSAAFYSAPKWLVPPAFREPNYFDEPESEKVPQREKRAQEAARAEQRDP